ncbi:MAG: SDR family oxidoreductase [bacterium]|nr:SDR family oxidoreductase [bacterium]
MSCSASPANMIDLTGRVVLVTGAGSGARGGGSESVGGIVGSGIGSGIVRRFVATGATVVAHTRNSPTDHLRYPDGTPVATVRADLTTPDGPPGVIEETLELHGRLDGLVNNAGAQPIARFDNLTDQQFTDMMDINVTATHRLTQLAAATMRRNSDPGGGSIVHIASIEARHPTVMHGHYATSKAALVMHARAAALMYGPDGIRCNTVSPGLIDRPGLVDDWPEGVHRYLAAAPLQRLGTPEDVGDACVFLCSDLSRWITGTDLLVDGGVLTNTTW